MEKAYCICNKKYYAWGHHCGQKGTLVSHMEASQSSIPVAALPNQLPVDASGKTPVDSPRAWASATAKETRMKFQAPGFGLASSRLLQSFGNELVDRRSLCFSLSLSNKYINLKKILCCPQLQFLLTLSRCVHVCVCMSTGSIFIDFATVEVPNVICGGLE